MGRLENQVAVVTGGGRGIGRAIALELAREGASVVVSSRTRDQLDSVVDEIKRIGSGGLAVEADALIRDDSKEPVRQAIARFGKVDILVNNVGGGVPGDQNPYTHDDDTFEAKLQAGTISNYIHIDVASDNLEEFEYWGTTKVSSASS